MKTTRKVADHAVREGNGLEFDAMHPFVPAQHVHNDEEKEAR